MSNHLASHVEKGVDWLDYCEGNKSGVLVENTNLEAVQADATHMDYSKMGSSDIDVLTFKFKTKGCQYRRRKYRKMGSCGTFVSYYNGVHHHTNPLIDQGDHRGLTGDQKALVQKAFQSKKNRREISLHSFGQNAQNFHMNIR